MKADSTSPLKLFEQLCLGDAIQLPQALACSASHKKLHSIFLDFQAMVIGFYSSLKMSLKKTNEWHNNQHICQLNRSLPAAVLVGFVPTVFP